MIIKSLNCDHNRSCRAYAFYEVRKKLKEEFLGKHGSELG